MNNLEEKKVKKVDIEVVISYRIEDEFPEDWTQEFIGEYVRDNISEYTNFDGEIVEVEVKC